MPQAQANGITIAYDSIGPDTGEPLLLISGLGVQMIRWAMPFCEALAARGYRVIRFDNRDAGLSTRLTASPVPDIGALAAAAARGEGFDVPYTLPDMAADAVELLDALAIDRAHLVGRSMGGMIAQLIAGLHPHRARSLVPIMSSTNDPSLPPADPALMAMLTRRAPNSLDDEAGYIDHGLTLARLIGSPGYPFDEAAWRRQLLAERRRAHAPAGFNRQIAAIVATGSLRPYLPQVAVPTCVIHGAEDRLIPVAGGRDIAAMIPGADLLVIKGMGHDVPPALHDVIVEAIDRTARRHHQ
jgi:pimeloyl-ACP methyl ester carboxylesterase